MKEFKSWRSYWYFEKSVKEDSRYIYTSETKEFFDTVLASNLTRIKEYKTKSKLWRAQIGYKDYKPYHDDDGKYLADIPVAFDADRMKPCKKYASEGRVNPKGILYLYLSDDKDTAMSEVRPWKDNFISIGEFELLREVRLINCTFKYDMKKYHFVEPSAKEKEIAVWKDIDKAFAKPVTLDENIADYVPTQILAELFKSKGFDGIEYRSSIGDGHNIVLFDLNDAKMVNCTLNRTEKININFKCPDVDDYLVESIFGM